jgi:Dolichyl-phosphate-mannose-protein mannosyltransferase
MIRLPSYLVYITCFICVLVVFWLVFVTSVPTDQWPIKDETNHVLHIVKLIKLVDSPLDVAKSERLYGPMYYFLAYVVGKSTDSFDRVALAFPNLLFLLGTVALIWQAGCLLFNKKTALLSALIASVFLFKWACFMTTELSLAFFATLFFYACVLIVKKGNSTESYIILAIAVAGGLLSKRTAPIFFAGPILWLLTTAWRRKNLILTVRFGAAALASGFLIAYFVFYRHFGLEYFFQDTMSRALFDTSAVPLGTHPFFYLAFAFKYLAGTLLLWFLLQLLKRKMPAPDSIALFALSLVPLLLLSFFPVKFAEYCIPAIPVLGLAIVGMVFDTHRSPRAQRVLTFGLLTTCLVPMIFLRASYAVEMVNYGPKNAETIRRVTAGIPDIFAGPSVYLFEPGPGGIATSLRIDLIRAGISEISLPDIQGTMRERLAAAPIRPWSVERARFADKIPQRLLVSVLNMDLADECDIKKEVELMETRPWESGTRTDWQFSIVSTLANRFHLSKTYRIPGTPAGFFLCEAGSTTGSADNPS